MGYAWDWIEDVASSLLNKFISGDDLQDPQVRPDYTLIKYPNSPNIYRLERDPLDESVQVKRRIENEQVFESLNYRWDRVIEIDTSEEYDDGEALE